MLKTKENISLFLVRHLLLFLLLLLLRDIINKLVSPTLILDLPAISGPYHNGGNLVIGSSLSVSSETAQNNKTGPPVDGTGGIRLYETALV